MKGISYQKYCFTCRMAHSYCFWSFFFQFVTCEGGGVGFRPPCCWLLFVCYWCWGLKCLLEAIRPFHTWSTCSPWWKAPLDPHSERARATMLVSNCWEYSWCHFSIYPAWGKIIVCWSILSMYPHDRMSMLLMPNAFSCFLGTIIEGYMTKAWL